MRVFFFLSVSLVFMLYGGQRAQAQAILSLKDTNSFCSFGANDVVPNDLYSFSSSEEARKLVAEIMSTVGLVPRFTVYSANVPNAAAVIKGDKRLILYSESWMQNTISSHRWAAVALLGHEIAHHLNGHTLTAGGSRPLTELEADKFAGFTVGKLGGTLADAQWLFQQLSSAGSETHPPKSARLEAVAVGWRDATRGTTVATAPPSPATPPPPTTFQSRWLVVAGSFPHAAVANANKRLRQLQGQGLNVEIVNSDDFSNLRNGLFVIVIRANNKTSALRELTGMQVYVSDAYIKQGS